MTTTTPLAVTYASVSETGDKFTTPEQIQEYANTKLAEIYHDAPPGLRPRVSVTPAEDGEVIFQVSVTGEGYTSEGNKQNLAISRSLPVASLSRAERVERATFRLYSQVLQAISRHLHKTTP